MNQTFSSHILTQLHSAGFTVQKCPTDKEWLLLDGSNSSAKILLRSRSLGELTKKSAKEFSLDWE